MRELINRARAGDIISPVSFFVSRTTTGNFTSGYRSINSLSLTPFLRYKVTVVAKEYASPVASGKCVTSEIAGALWEWPPAVCGRHIDETSLERSKVWCMDSYAKFMELAMKPKETGAYLRQSVFYFKKKVHVILPKFVATSVYVY